VVAAASLRDGAPRPPAPAAAAATAAAAAAALGERAAECTVGYVVSGATDGRFTTEVSVANTGVAEIPAARLTFTLPGEQRLRSGAPGRWRQSGRTVSAQIGDLAAGRSRTATIRGTYRAMNALPDRFQLNGTTCRAALSVAGQTGRPAPAAKIAEPDQDTVPKAKPKKAKKNKKK
jgi:serine/threonine-protein kinase